MKIARFFAVIFAVLGVVLMLGTAVFCFTSLGANVKILETPTGAVECADQLIRAIDAGDLESAAGLLYGQPELGTEGVPGDSVSALLWAAFREEMACEAAGKLRLEGSDFARSATVTVLDVQSLTLSVQTRAKALLEKKVAQATDMSELYDAQNNFRQDLIDQVMLEALNQAMAQDTGYLTYDVTFRLICQDGQWWALPDQKFLTALSGGLA